MIQQTKFFIKDVTRMLGKYKIRMIHIWLSRAFWGIFIYRLERGLYLTIGRPYEIIRIILIPFFNLIQAYSNIEIHYKADIGPGLLIFSSFSRNCNIWSFKNWFKLIFDRRKYYRS